MCTVVRNSLQGRSRTARSLQSYTPVNLRPKPEHASLEFPRLRRAHKSKVFSSLYFLPIYAVTGPLRGTHCLSATSDFTPNAQSFKGPSSARPTDSRSEPILRRLEHVYCQATLRFSSPGRKRIAGLILAQRTSVSPSQQPQLRTVVHEEHMS